ncbi:uncharacterized protein LOC117122289, partial [Anneissia japonica]|uniref:uncharacterized protein LOC117122289 n=1 Tax=Anneissia japonica TaxID=1529436 RepID=UPI001425758C
MLTTVAQVDTTVDLTEAPVNPTEAGEKTVTVCSTCMSDVVITSRWSGNFQATITVTLTNTVTAWNMNIYFSEPVDSIDVYQAIELSISNDNMVYSISNENYNGDQSAGAMLTLEFQASYSGSEPSTIRIEDMTNQPDCCTEVVVTLPIPTAAPGEGCATCCSTTAVTSEWQGNFVGEFRVPITRRVSNGWTAEIHFSSAVNSLTMHDADVIGPLNGNTVYQIRNRQHNADYSPGDENTQSFQATISGNTPTFYVYMVGQPQCCGGGCETTEVDPTDPPQVDPTEAPVDPAETHVYPTETPEDSTKAKVDPTEAQVDPTEAQVLTTEAQVGTTEAEVEPTE